MSKKAKRSKSTKEPVRYDPPIEIEEEPETQAPKYRMTLAYVLDQDEVNRLIEASSAPYEEQQPAERSAHYATYTEDEVLALVDGAYKTKKSKKRK